jgi:type II secretory pathway pseudopilin PulG
MGSSTLEQIAVIIVVGVVSVLGIAVKWLMGQKDGLEKRLVKEAQARMEKEALDELKSKGDSLPGLVDTINERLRRERGE